MADLSCVPVLAESIRLPVWLERLGGQVTDPRTGEAYDLLRDYVLAAFRESDGGRISCEFSPRAGAACGMASFFLVDLNAWVHLMVKEGPVMNSLKTDHDPKVTVPAKVGGEPLPLTHAEAVARRRRINGWTVTSTWPDNRQRL